MRIFVDADAFPGVIKEFLFRTVERVRVPLILVANQHLRTPQSEHISSVQVGAGPDVADDYIVDQVQPGELVITADIPLADRVVGKGAYAINPRGELYDTRNVKQKLGTRDLMDQLRSAGLITGGPSSYNPQDRQAFANQLDKFLAKNCPR